MYWKSLYKSWHEKQIIREEQWRRSWMGKWKAEDKRQTTENNVVCLYKQACGFLPSLAGG